MLIFLTYSPWSQRTQSIKTNYKITKYKFKQNAPYARGLLTGRGLGLEQGA